MNASQALEARKENKPAVVAADMVKQYEKSLTTMLPTHIKPDAWMRLATKALRNDNLRLVAERNPQSLITALMECARLGHEPASNEFYLVPIGGSIEGWESYRGKIERIYRAGAVSTVTCEVVYSRDTFIWTRGKIDQDNRWQGPQEFPYHECEWFDDRGEMKGVYAYATMKDGSISKVVVMNKQQIEKHKAESKTASRTDSMWNKWPEQAWLKTAMHQLEKYVPTSSEYVREQYRALKDVESEQAAQRMDRQPAAIPLSASQHVEAERVEEPTNVDTNTGEILDVEEPPEVQGWPTVQTAGQK